MKDQILNKTLNTQVRGAQIQTKEAFLYGRFECMMKPGYGSGIISSFFTFNDKPNFKNNWNEIDFEFLGRNTNQVDTNVIITLDGKTDKNINVQHNTLNKRSTDIFWKLSIDWTPERIIWQVNDVTIRTKVVRLNKPQKLMMNIWKSDSANWAGEFNPGLLSQEATYEYVRVSGYENGKYVFKWQDEFNKLDLNRWQIADWPLEGTEMYAGNVSIRNDKLILKLS